MAGSKIGGSKAAATNKKRHGKDFYQRIGSMGGKLGTTGGFAADRKRASNAGATGGNRSRRGLTYIETKDGYHHYVNKKTGQPEKRRVT